jgi:DnaJ family protein A protein 5
MGIFDQFYEKAKSIFGESKELHKKKDYYELLEVDSKATENEIKKSYRRLALLNHPDKNIGKEEECAAYFTLIQQAYEVLMDPRERAFYDKHKDNILRDQDASEETRDEGTKLFEYFQPCFKDFGDDPKGFYSVYREVFDRLAMEEFPYLDEDEEKNFPTFGQSDSSYDMVVAPFYDFWTNFNTSRTFAWLDKWNLRDGPNRATVRAMEKENRKLREAGKNERNDEIRSLAAYIRKRDPRVKAFRSILEERKKKTQEEVEARRKQKIRENLEQLEEHVIDEETIKEHLQDLEEIENQLDAEFGLVKEGGTNGDDSDEKAHYCVVCEKGFKTA